MIENIEIEGMRWQCQIDATRGRARSRFSVSFQQHSPQVIEKKQIQTMPTDMPKGDLAYAPTPTPTYNSSLRSLFAPQKENR